MAPFTGENATDTAVFWGEATGADGRVRFVTVCEGAEASDGADADENGSACTVREIGTPVGRPMTEKEVRLVRAV